MLKIFLEIAMNLHNDFLLEIYNDFRIPKTVFKSFFTLGIVQKQSALIPFSEFLFYLEIGLKMELSIHREASFKIHKHTINTYKKYFAVYLVIKGPSICQ